MLTLLALVKLRTREFSGLSSSMSGAGRKGGYRKGVTSDVLDGLPEPEQGESIVQVVGLRGSNLMEIVSPHGRGLGALFDSGKTNADYPLMFAVLIALALLGIVLYYVVVALEKIFAGWAERETS